jgi:glutaredoxin
MMRRRALASARMSTSEAANRTPPEAMPTVTVYSKPDCHLCEEAMRVLERLRRELQFHLEEIDITADEALHRAYFERIPVVALGGQELFEYHVSEQLMRERLESRR